MIATVYIPLWYFGVAFIGLCFLPDAWRIGKRIVAWVSERGASVSDETGDAGRGRAFHACLSGHSPARSLTSKTGAPVNQAAAWESGQLTGGLTVSAGGNRGDAA